MNLILQGLLFVPSNQGAPEVLEILEVLGVLQVLEVPVVLEVPGVPEVPEIPSHIFGVLSWCRLYVLQS